MRQRQFTGKRVLCILFSICILTSCSESPRQWLFSSTAGSHPDFRSSKLSLAPENDFTGLEIEILNTSQGRHVYVNAFSLELQAEGRSSEGYPTISVGIEFAGHQEIVTGFLLQGGHRILLEEQAGCMIIEALHCHQNINLTVAQFSTTIIPDEFTKHYQKL